MRLDDAEIRMTFAGDQTEAALQALDLPAGRPTWRIRFREDVVDGVSPGTPLLDAGVILRARDKPGRKGDATVKLRPGRRSRLTDRWLRSTVEDGREVEVHADWTRIDGLRPDPMASVA